MTGEIYTDNGASLGRRTRLFRNCASGNGVEWMYAVDHAGGDDRWYGFHAAAGGTIESMIKAGMRISPASCMVKEDGGDEE